MEARRQKVGRGLVLTQVPVGYVRTEDEGIEKTPDRQVQEAIAGIFRKFRELGSVRQVLLWYRDEKLLIPALSRESGHRQMVWIEPVYPRIFGILKNPTYAGFFVWGRNHTRTSIVDGRHARHVVTLGRWSSGKLPFRITTKGILRGKSLCAISGRSVLTRVGTRAWGVRMVQ
jgi:hypothetical protein